jgi:peptidoglycan-associated lipoprotein
MAIMVVGLIAGACKHPKPPGIPIAVRDKTPEPGPPTTAPCEAPSVSITANGNTINAGQNSTLTWQAFNADSLRIEPEIGNVALTGNRQVSPPVSVTYTAYATSKCGTQSGVTRITVNQRPAQGPTQIVENGPGERTEQRGSNGNGGGPVQTTNTGRGPTTPTDSTFAEGIKNILFDYDKAEIRSDQMPHLQADATWLKQHPNVRVIVEGHADERGNQEYNLALGVRRANNIVQYLVGQGVAESRLRSISFGQERPDCRDANPDETCHQRNRRAAFTQAQ